MTSQPDFSEEEWELVREAPPTAGMIVLTAQSGGTCRESFAIGKAYGEARQQHGASELLDSIVNAKPKVDRGRFGSVDELRQHGLGRLRDAVALLETKATPDEVDGFRGFVLAVADKVANAHREDGEREQRRARGDRRDIRGARRRAEAGVDRAVMAARRGYALPSRPA
jgi:hypothetical protein